jgi:hypothetical protein
MKLGRALAIKFEQPQYAAQLAARGIPPPSHGMVEEQTVRRIRAGIAAARKTPDGVAVLTIPRLPGPPTFDGLVQEQEWRGALRINLAPADLKGVVFVAAHGATLYFGASAPADKTETGFDQFRFWYHGELSPYMENERIFVAGQGARTTALRGARLPRVAAPVLDPPDPKTLAQKTDWGVLERIRGMSKVAGFRQYELAVDLQEAGIAPGVPFPAWLEIEGDPELTADGKFKARVSMGEAGSAKQPLWLRVAR